MTVSIETAQSNAANELRKDWGKSYDENLQKAAAIAKTYLGSDVLDTQLKDGTRLGDNVKVIKAFANIASLLSEDKIVGTGNDNITKARDLDAEIRDITNNKQGAFWNKMHPDHEKTVAHVLALRELKHAQNQ